MAHDVFISHSSQDKTIADAICATLERSNIRCWIAPRDVMYGEEWAPAIIKAIKQSRIFVLIFSSNSNNGEQVKREVKNAADMGIPIIPFRIKNEPLSDHMQYYISTAHWLDALTPPLEDHLEELTKAVSRLLSIPTNIKVPPIKQPPKRSLRGLRSLLAIGTTIAVIGIAIIFLIFIGQGKWWGKKDSLSEYISQTKIPALKGENLPQSASPIIVEKYSTQQANIIKSHIADAEKGMLPFEPQGIWQAYQHMQQALGTEGLEVSDQILAAKVHRVMAGVYFAVYTISTPTVPNTSIPSPSISKAQEEVYRLSRNNPWGKAAKHLEDSLRLDPKQADSPKLKKTAELLGSAENLSADQYGEIMRLLVPASRDSEAMKLLTLMMKERAKQKSAGK